MDQRDFKPSRTTRLFVALLATVVLSVIWDDEASSAQRAAAPATDASVATTLR
jgi:hypothetical protein